MRELRHSGSVTQRISARPEEVWDLLADAGNMARWSPEVIASDWLPPATTAVVGARLVGTSRAGIARWRRVAEVVDCEPPHRFAFRTVPGRGLARDATEWRFAIAPDGDGGSVVTESYEIVLAPSRRVLRLVQVLAPQHLDPRPGMRRTLDALRRELEAV